jgi:heme exporter protein B
MRGAVAAVLRKDLQVELRTLESIPAMTLFAVTTFVLFRFGLDRETVDGDLAAGVFWVTVLFAAVLGLNRLFVAEEEQGGFDGFLLAPVDRTALFVAKATALFLFLAVVEIVAVPAFAILLLGPSPFPALPGLIVVLVLGNAGICVIGTLIAGIAVRTRARDLIGPLITLPLLVPVILAASEASTPLFAAGGAEALPVRWVTVLGIYDLIFGLIAYGVFDFLLED